MLTLCVNIELDPRMELSTEDMTAAEIAPRPANIHVNIVCKHGARSQNGTIHGRHDGC